MIYIFFSKLGTKKTLSGCARNSWFFNYCFTSEHLHLQVTDVGLRTCVHSFVALVSDRGVQAVAGCAQCSLGFDLKPFLLLPASSFSVAAVCALNAALAELPHLRHSHGESLWGATAIWPGSKLVPTMFNIFGQFFGIIFLNYPCFISR